MKIGIENEEEEVAFVDAKSSSRNHSCLFCVDSVVQFLMKNVLFGTVELNEFEERGFEKWIKVE